ncbi:MAG: hypothetical protein H8E44_18885 [Planctomycetes bacterium]|nr:hypothetical protein [Planctomycetota bacterium]MBL7038311.1 hypothetical protein [Pirellulaceae bacterium]
MVATPRKPAKPALAGESDSDPAEQVYVYLSEQDRDIVLETIENDVQANDALRSLAQRYKERYG